MGALPCTSKFLFLLVAVASIFQLQTEVVALGSEALLLSRLENAQCELQMSVGRIPGSAMPPEWAASGAKLGLPLEVEFSSEACAEYEMTKERLLGGGAPSNYRAVEPLTEPTFISSKGQEHVKVKEGAYGCELRQLEAQLYSIRFFLDFPDGAVRNDIVLPAERIYFISQCWIENEKSIERAKLRKQEIEAELQKINAELAEWESGAFFEKALRIRQSVLSVERRDRLETQLAELERTYPLQMDGIIRGPNGVLFSKEGIISVKRFRGAMGTREQYHWVGTFTIKEFFEDEEDGDDNESIS